MRVAVSGTHCSGKTTLVEYFVERHREYIHEPEPYEWLETAYGEVLVACPTADDFFRQLEISVERLATYPSGSNLIAERAPVDFLAYIQALNDLGRSPHDATLISLAESLAMKGMASVDLLVVLPLNVPDDIAAPESEDPDLREAMNESLLELVGRDDLLGDALRVIEIHGSRNNRLRLLEEALARAGAHP